MCWFRCCGSTLPVRRIDHADARLGDVALHGAAAEHAGTLEAREVRRLGVRDVELPARPGSRAMLNRIVPTPVEGRGADGREACSRSTRRRRDPAGRRARRRSSRGPSTSSQSPVGGSNFTIRPVSGAGAPAAFVLGPGRPPGAVAPPGRRAGPRRGEAVADRRLVDRGGLVARVERRDVDGRAVGRERARRVGEEAQDPHRSAAEAPRRDWSRRRPRRRRAARSAR